MTQLESDLRGWMHARAARVHASPKLLEADYRPRANPMRPRIAFGAGLAAVAGALSAVLSLVGGVSNAFAGWTPEPRTATPAQLTAARAYCAKNVPNPGLALKATDARGPFTTLVYSNGGSNDFCTVGPSFRNAWGWSTSPRVTPPADGLYLWSDHIAIADGQPYGTMIARAGDRVSAASVTLTNGSVVTATVEHGWVVAWWPGAQHVVAAQLTTSIGTNTQTFPRYPCDVHNCHRGGRHRRALGGGPSGG